MQFKENIECQKVSAEHLEVSKCCREIIYCIYSKIINDSSTFTIRPVYINQFNIKKNGL